MKLTLDSLTSKSLRTSGLQRLLLAGALALVLVPLGSVAVETASVTCGFSSPFEGPGSYGGSYCNGGDSTATQTTSRFDFGAYYLELTFDLVFGHEFEVTVNTTEMSPEAFSEKAGETFGSYTCIALTPGGPCVDFEVVPSVEQAGNWTHYQLEIHWDKIEGQELDPALMTILHDIGDTGTRDYDEDMCLNTSNDACTINPDPGIRSGDTDFRSFTAALRPATVPEPSSLALLGTGLTGLVFQLRRRRQKPEEKPTA